MIEILHRRTKEVLYTSETAQTIANAVVEAKASGANLSGADLSGADLSGAKGILRISGGRHDVIAQTNGMVQIGCHYRPIGEWLEHYKAFGRAEGYSVAEVEEYSERLRFCAAWIERSKAATEPVTTAEATV